MRKWLIILVLITIGIISYNYIYKDHRDIKTEQADFIISTDSLKSTFSNYPLKSEKKYLNKTIVISGIITEINTSDITIENYIFCNFGKQVDKSPIEKNNSIKVKGRFIGYDDLLELVKLDQCYVLE